MKRKKKKWTTAFKDEFHNVYNWRSLEDNKIIKNSNRSQMIEVHMEILGRQKDQM